MRVLTPGTTPELSTLSATDLTASTWIDAATPCRSHDPELWFAESADQIELAQALCRTCPLQASCLAGALARSEPWGVWGGELFEGGVPIPRKRRPGRPRKTDHLDKQAAEQALAGRLAELAELRGLTADLDSELAHLSVTTEPVGAGAGCGSVQAPRDGGVAA